MIARDAPPLPTTTVRDLLAVLLLCGAQVARWHAAIFAPVPLYDERVYFVAFADVARGVSPYRGVFFYPPSFALLGASFEQHLGHPATLALLRSVNVLAMAGVVWFSLSCLLKVWHHRLLAAALYVAFTPAAHLSIGLGNLSPLAIALLLGALLLSGRRPLAAGLVAAISLLLKPLGLAAMGLLATHPPTAGAGPRRQTGVLALAVTAAVLLPAPYLTDFLGAPAGGLKLGRNVSLHRWLHLLGLDISPILLAGGVTLVAIVIVWRQTLDETLLLALATTASVLATPIVWNHTLLLVLPLQAAALATAIRLRTPRGRLGSYELVCVGLLVLSIQLCEGIGGVEDLAPVIQTVALAVPCFAPALLTAYLFAARRWA